MDLKAAITLSENMVYSVLSHRSWDISHWYITKADLAEIIKKKSSTSNPNIYETVSHSTINTIFWKCITRSFKCMYVNCFDRLIFLAESAQNCKKYTFLDN